MTESNLNGRQNTLNINFKTGLTRENENGIINQVKKTTKEFYKMRFIPTASDWIIRKRIQKVFKGLKIVAGLVLVYVWMVCMILILG